MRSTYCPGVCTKPGASYTVCMYLPDIVLWDLVYLMGKCCSTYACTCLPDGYKNIEICFFFWTCACSPHWHCCQFFWIIELPVFVNSMNTSTHV